VVEALEQLTADIGAEQGRARDAASRRRLIEAAGDVCELQEGQLHFAATELSTAVATIIASLETVAGLQRELRRETGAASGVMDGSGASFTDAIEEGLLTTTPLLQACAQSHQGVASTMGEMASSIGASATFVHEIDTIGYNIVKTALNAQIKAGKTGRQGAVLTALAEEIRRLSNEASRHTDTVARKLGAINTATTTRVTTANSGAEGDGAWLGGVETTTREIMAALGEMKGRLVAMVTPIEEKITTLAAEVAGITAGIEVHEQSRAVTDEVLIDLRLVIAQARQQFPASSQFKEGLRQMNERYTMESERRVHQAIASRHGVEAPEAQGELPAVGDGGSEFGDNVDLF
jgi:hypothetical protein